MARKTVQEPTLQEQSNITASLIFAGRALLKNLLLDGADTGQVRRELVELEKDRSRLATLIAAEDDAQQAALDARLFAQVDALARQATDRITATLAALAAPVAPWA